jgi:hypothetical protein
MKKSEWIGIDASLDISLFEYGLLTCKNSQCTKPDEWFCLVGVDKDDEGYNKFDYGYIQESDFAGESWIEWDEVLSFVGMTFEEWQELSFVMKLSDLISYYGTENFGFGIYNSFEIKPDELDSYVTNMV